MPADARPYCGQCGSGAVDSERDPDDGMIIVYCRACGNRTTKADPLAKTKFFMRGKDEIMAKAGEKIVCPNCKRVQSNQGGLCFLCRKAVTGLTKGSDAYGKALENVKKRIESGNMGRWKRTRETVGEQPNSRMEDSGNPPDNTSSDLSGVAELEGLMNENPDFMAGAKEATQEDMGSETADTGENQDFAHKDSLEYEAALAEIRSRIDKNGVLTPKKRPANLQNGNRTGPDSLPVSVPVTPDGKVIPLYLKLFIDIDVRVNRAIGTS